MTEVTIFHQQQHTRKLLEELYPELDAERVNDVAKYLRVIMKGIALQSSIFQEIKQNVEDHPLTLRDGVCQLPKE